MRRAELSAGSGRIDDRPAEGQEPGSEGRTDEARGAVDLVSGDARGEIGYSYSEA